MPKEQDDDPVALDMSDALRSTLRAVVENTNGAFQGVITTMLAAAALQCFYREKCGPQAQHMIDTVNRAIQTGAQYEKLIRFVQETIDEIGNEANEEPEAPPTRFYGQA